MRKPLFKEEIEIIDDDNQVSAFEVNMLKKSIADNKPVHFSAAILQHSKLLFLRYISVLMTQY